MNKKNIILALLLVLGIQGFTQNYNQTLGQTTDDVNTITTSVPFLMIAPDSRSGGMGDAGVSSTPDANSQHWNPAKYAFIDDDLGFSVSYSPWLRALVNDIYLAYLSGYKKIGRDQAISASLLFFSLGEINFTDKTGQDIGSFSPNEFSVDVAYSRKFTDNLSGAVSLRYIYSNLTGGIFVGGSKSKPGQAVASDVSVYYRKKFEMNGQDALFAFGTNISNLGNKISYTETTERDFLPMNLRIGPSLTVDLDKYNTISVMLDMNKLLVPTPPIWARDSAGAPIPGTDGNYLIAQGKDPNVGIVTGMFNSFTDAPGGTKEELHEIAYSAGLEYWYDKQFAIRAGYFHEHKYKGNRKYFTLGAGLKYNVFGLDFAYLIPATSDVRSPLENTLRFTLLFDFDAFQDQNKPSVEK
ncbi:MAG: type IX secretion system outer membrane channel protein PorV [Saprospiraceae bacterium]|nr:type IX secretion system outer membrane channel protein PorV [Saprospiraceae bacterium]